MIRGEKVRDHRGVVGIVDETTGTDVGVSCDDELQVSHGGPVRGDDVQRRGRDAGGVDQTTGLVGWACDVLCRQPCVRIDDLDDVVNIEREFRGGFCRNFRFQVGSFSADAGRIDSSPGIHEIAVEGNRLPRRSVDPARRTRRHLYVREMKTEPVRSRYADAPAPDGRVTVGGGRLASSSPAFSLRSRGRQPDGNHGRHGTGESIAERNSLVLVPHSDGVNLVHRNFGSVWQSHQRISARPVGQMRSGCERF